MFRNTGKRAMVPYLHAFTPGCRPSEKGMLYRNNNMNMHARLASISPSQRTRWEGQTFLILMFPDQLFLMAGLGAATAIAMVLYTKASPYTNNTHKQQWYLGAMTEHEYYARNDEMGRIFDAHAEQAANTRAEAQEPPVFTAPDTYTSASGRYAQKAAV